MPVEINDFEKLLEEMKALREAVEAKDKEIAGLKDQLEQTNNEMGGLEIFRDLLADPPKYFNCTIRNEQLIMKINGMLTLKYGKMVAEGGHDYVSFMQKTIDGILCFVMFDPTRRMLFEQSGYLK